MRYYTTDREFKQAIEERLDTIISHKAWMLLTEVLFTGAIHAPYTDADVEFAIKKMERIRRITNE